MKPKYLWWLPCLAAIQTLCLAQTQVGSVGINRYGSTGLLTIPTADIAPDGTFDFAVGKAYDPFFRLGRGTNYLFVVSPYRNIELGGRLAEYAVKAPGSGFIVDGSRDLSANIKFQLVRTESATRLAFGVNDIAGGAVNLRSAYGVLTQDVGAFSISSGLVLRGANGRSGLFAGARVGIVEPVYLLADIDPNQTALGARAQVPLPFLPSSPRLDLSVSRSFPRSSLPANGATDVQVALRFPLSNSQPQYDPGRTSGTTAKADAFPAWPAQLASLGASSPAQNLQTKLQSLGLGNVSVRHDAKQAWVRVQNVAYAHSNFDALAVALTGIARELPAGVEDIFLQLQVNKIDVGQIYAKRSAWQRFMDGGMRPIVGAEININQAMASVPAIADVADSAPISIRVEPTLRTFIGTEFGAADYAVAARALAQWEGIPLAGGRLLASVGVTSSAKHTESFDDGQVDVMLRPKSGLDSAMVHWAGWVAPQVLSLVSAGRYDRDYAGAGLEARWVNRPLPFNYMGTAIVKAGYFRNTKDAFAGNRAYALASLRSYIPASDLTTEIGFGQFQGGDRGPRVDVSRNFGDVNFGFTWRYTNKHFLGMQMGIPLTPRINNSRLGPLHLTGTNSFSHAIRTTYLGKGQPNLVIPAAAQIPVLPIDLSTHILDRGRLTNEEIFGYLIPMRDFARKVLADNATR